MRLPSCLRAALLALTLIGLSACTTFHKAAPAPRLVDGHLEKTYYDAELTAPDGVKIRMTVYQPALKVGETAPLILHAHGFALHRMDKPRSMYGKYLLAGTSARAAWDRGYWVISYDQRGHGQSGGSINLIDRDKEAADVSRVIDWAVKNLALSQKDGDPLVGMIGESYGGGAQLMATVQEPRLDALVPITTWYDLDKALLPNDVPKSEWLAFLAVGGYTMNPLNMNGGLVADMFKAVLFDKKDPFLHERLKDHSLAYNCGPGQYPHADALLIQGFRDVLFPMNQALGTRDCFQRAGRDVRLIGVEHGHLMPGSQFALGTPIWHVADTVQCGGQERDLKTMIGLWFDSKLRGVVEPVGAIPAYCMTGDPAVDSLGAPPALSWQDVPRTGMGSGLFELAAKPLDSLGNLLVPARLPRDWQKPESGWLRPGRVALLAPDQPTWIMGAAQLDVNVTGSDRDAPVVFVQLAAWRPGSGSYRVLSQQVTPLRGTGRQNIELAAVRDRIEPGEVLGLLFSGWSNQYRLSGSGVGTDASISGRIGLPIVPASSSRVAGS